MSTSTFVKITDGYPTIDIGAMRHCVTIVGPVATGTQVFDEGGATVTETEVAKGWAAIDAVRGLDVIRGGQTTTQLYLTIAMWFDPAVASNMQVQHSNGSTYVIQSLENVLEMNVVMILNCIALGPNP